MRSPLWGAQYMPYGLKATGCPEGIYWAKRRSSFQHLKVQYALRLPSGESISIYAQRARCSCPFGATTKRDEGPLGPFGPASSYRLYISSRFAIALWATSKAGPEGNRLRPPKGRKPEGGQREAIYRDAPSGPRWAYIYALPEGASAYWSASPILEGAVNILE